MEIQQIKDKNREGQLITTMSKVVGRKGTSSRYASLMRPLYYYARLCVCMSRKHMGIGLIGVANKNSVSDTCGSIQA